MKNIISDLDLVLFDSVEWIKETCPCCENDSYLNREAWNMHHAHVDMVKLNYDFIKIFQDWVDVGVERVFFITSREDINGMRDKTLKQLRDFLSHVKGADKLTYYLYMRNMYDYRPSQIIKEETFLQKILPYFYIDLAVDDSAKNCDVFRKYGINTWLYDKY